MVIAGQEISEKCTGCWQDNLKRNACCKIWSKLGPGKQLKTIDPYYFISGIILCVLLFVDHPHMQESHQKTPRFFEPVAKMLFLLTFVRRVINKLSGQNTFLGIFKLVDLFVGVADIFLELFPLQAKLLGAHHHSRFLSQQQDHPGVSIISGRGPTWLWNWSSFSTQVLLLLLLLLLDVFLDTWLWNCSLLENQD